MCCCRRKPALPATDVLGRSATTLTTTRAGRLFVSKTLLSLQVTCTGSVPWRAWLTVDAVPVPGTVVNSVPSASTLRPLTLSGVTVTSLPSGEHTVRVAIDCIGNAHSNVTSFGNQNAAAVVLG